MDFPGNNNNNNKNEHMLDYSIGKEKVRTLFKL